MAIQMAPLARAKRMFRRPLSTVKHIISTAAGDVPTGHFTVFVGQNEKKRFVLPIAYLNEPTFKDLLTQAEEEFGFHQPNGWPNNPMS